VTCHISDAAVDLYFDREGYGMESNRLPAGEDFFLTFGRYGSKQALFAKTSTLSDIEMVKR